MQCLDCKAHIEVIVALRQALSDAARMFQDIERSRQLPSEAQTLAQYRAMGREIRKLLADTVD